MQPPVCSSLAWSTARHGLACMPPRTWPRGMSSHSRTIHSVSSGSRARAPLTHESVKHTRDVTQQPGIFFVKKHHCERCSTLSLSSRVPHFKHVPTSPEISARPNSSGSSTVSRTPSKACAQRSSISGQALSCAHPLMCGSLVSTHRGQIWAPESSHTATGPVPRSTFSVITSRKQAVALFCRSMFPEERLTRPSMTRGSIWTRSRLRVIWIYPAPFGISRRTSGSWWCWRHMYSGRWPGMAIRSVEHSIGKSIAPPGCESHASVFHTRVARTWW
jgi:hypothetical protein